MGQRAAIYARLSVSSTDKDAGEEEVSDSIESQLAALRKLAKANFYTVVGEFVDDGISGYKGKNRPAFNRLLKTIADGDVDVVLARHSDRLERNEEEGFLIRVASARTGVLWHFGSGMTLDPSTSEGGLLAKILSAIAQFESQIKTERLKQHFAARRAQGLDTGSRAFGYMGSELIPEEAELIRDAYKAVDDGLTVGSIVRQWNAAKVPQRKGGKGWTYAHMNSILKRPRNAGLVVHEGHVVTDDNGEAIKGQWTPIVPMDQWERVQVILSDPGRRTSPGTQPTRLTSGLALCGVCARPMYSNTVADNRSGTRYSILRCSRIDKSDGLRHPSARTEDVEEMAREAIVAAYLFGTIDLFSSEEVDLGSLQEALTAVLAAQNEIAVLMGQKLLKAAQAAPQLEELNEEESRLRSRIEAATAHNASAHMVIDLMKGTTIDDKVEAKKILRDRFDALHIEQKRRIVDQLLDIRVLGGRGKKKYVITHKLVTSLNEDQMSSRAHLDHSSLVQ